MNPSDKELMECEHSHNEADAVARDWAMTIAMIVRNAMEDFHVEHLSDAQMRELNPIIRDAIFTGLYSLLTGDTNKASRAYVSFANLLVPEYWEDPDLLDDYLNTADLLDKSS